MPRARGLPSSSSEGRPDVIPDAQVEEVRARADLVEVIGELVPLKQSGKDLKANCPFHDERTPSFYVVPAKGFFKCFGCGESGDVFSFVMKRLGLDFVEAVKYVAVRSGVEVHEVSRGSEAEEDPFRAHYEANAFAKDFYRRMLLEPEVGRDARDYLSHRGIDDDTAERFGLGYAPDDWRLLRDAAAAHGISDALMLEVGLLTTSERAPEPYDRFRHRIMFPIEDRERVAAFGGRVLGTGGVGRGSGREPAKYVNTSETPIYQKGEVLYGLGRAKHAIRRAKLAIVVEGYMDVVSLAAAGFENVVAPLGTSLTSAQVELLARYTKRVLLLFDSDDSGFRATFRSGDVLLAHGLHPAVVTLPAGEDPDTLVRKQGAGGLSHYLDQAVDVLDCKLQMLQQHNYFSSIDGTQRALDKLLPTVRAAADPTLRDLYVSRVAERTGIRRETLEAELDRAALRRPHASRGPAPRGGAERDPARDASIGGAPPVLGAERALVQIIACDRERRQERLEALLRHIGPEDFTDPAWRRIFQAFLDDPELARTPPDMDHEAARRLEALLDDREGLLHPERVFNDALAQLRLTGLERRRHELDALMSASTDEAEKQALAVEKARVAREAREIGLGWSHAARRLADPQKRESRNSTERTG
ncbi:MAG: DNA primase [Gemmatimonadota bacterium]|nr:DNA primase [Gemmatimonadota bacterium]